MRVAGVVRVGLMLHTHLRFFIYCKYMPHVLIVSIYLMYAIITASPCSSAPRTREQESSVGVYSYVHICVYAYIVEIVYAYVRMCICAYVHMCIY